MTGLTYLPWGSVSSVNVEQALQAYCAEADARHLTLAPRFSRTRKPQGLCKCGFCGPLVGGVECKHCYDKRRGFERRARLCATPRFNKPGVYRPRICYVPV